MASTPSVSGTEGAAGAGDAAAQQSTAAANKAIGQVFQSLLDQLLQDFKADEAED